MIDDNDICIFFDYIIDSIDELRGKFIWTLQCGLETVERQIACAYNRHERASLIISKERILQQLGKL